MINTKIEGAISKIIINAATFHNEPITPTLINFFYGKNGVGKSTIGRIIFNNYGVEWKQGHSNNDYSVLVYNEDFIARNFSSNDSVQGIFTIGEEDVAIKTDIDTKTIERSKLGDDYKAKKAEIKKIKDDKNSRTQSFNKAVFDSAVEYRTTFKTALTGALKTDGFVSKLLNQNTAVNHDKKQLFDLYESAYSKDSKEYDLMNKIDDILLPTSSLLEKAIVSSSTSSFAEFVKKYQNSDWVRQGHEHFNDTDGKCPYCQQSLPNDFETQITTIFDTQYQDDINNLKSFRNVYCHNIDGITEVTQNNLKGIYPKINTDQYHVLMAQLNTILEGNLLKIDSKLNEPTTIVTLTELDALIQEINDQIVSFNNQIEDNNKIVNSKKKNQTDCTKQLWELIYSDLKPQIDAYKSDMKRFDDELERFTEELTDITSKGKAVKAELDKLTSKSVNTIKAIESINKILHDSGFQGFTIEENTNNTYKVVRPDGTIAENLSEGERNFIAFLYFCQLVHGADDSTGDTKDKIVVIDDPVSSMDSGALFVVGALTREMIEICRNNAASSPTGERYYIKQLFILTHNGYYHNDVAVNMVKYWDAVAYFKLVKADNNSQIIPCVFEIKDYSGNIIKTENINPVQNGYHMLWAELKELKTPNSVTHVIQQILNHYFIQMCSYRGGDVRDKILIDNKSKFIISDEADNETFKPEYYTIRSLLSYLTATEQGAVDNQQFIETDINVDSCKNALKSIFGLMGQDQHYSMMMGKEN